MSGILFLGAWLVTVWIHSLILSLAGIVVARCVGVQRFELRAVAWKVALLSGFFTASIQVALPGIGWGSVVLLQESALSLPPANGAGLAPAVLNASSLEAIEAKSSERWHAPAIDAANTMSVPTPQAAIRFACIAATTCFGFGMAVGLLRLASATRYLWRIVGRAQYCERADLLAILDRLQMRLGIRTSVDLLVSDEVAGPLATGITRQRVIVPSVALDGRLDVAQLEGLLAHELAHHKLRDPWWTLIGYLIVHAFWFQPLAHVVRRNMRIDAEYLADAVACRTLGDGLGLARCLATMAEWLAPRRDARLEVGGVPLFARRASLKHRVESLLVTGPPGSPPSLARRLQICTAIVGMLALLIAAAPVVKTKTPSQPIPSQPGEPEVNRTLAALTLAATLAAPAIVDEPKAGGQETRASSAEPKVPASVHGFSGEVVGTIVSKDTDGASLVLKVQKVTNVWKNSKAEQPRDLVGRTVPIEKFFGRFLDVLLVVKPGDTVMVEVKHVRGDQLQFLGELFKKVEPISSQETPSVGGSDRPANQATDKPADEPKTTEQDQGKFPAGLQGFRGILLGKVVKTDVERGVLVFQAESVKRTWPQNKATNPASSKGKEITVNGIAGKWLDVLLVLKPGDRIEVEAFHNRGEALDFVQEWLKKVD